MESLFFYILISTLSISFLSLIGILFLLKKHKKFERIVLYLVSLSTGTFLGGAFLHLLPEASENLDSLLIFKIILFSFIFYFLLEKIIHWRHCHSNKCNIHSFGYVNLFGDGVHNFIDGLIIASAFSVDIKLGFMTVVAIALHEIPQEIGDFGVLLHAGFKKKKALILNLLIALITTVGGLVGFIILKYIDSLLIYLLPFASGGFIYIAMSDLVPEIREERNPRKSILIFCFFLLGILIMWLTKFLD